MTADGRTLPEQVAELSAHATRTGMDDAAAWLQEQLARGRATDPQWFARAVQVTS